MSLSERARATRNEPLLAVLAEGDFSPHKCSLSVSLRYAPASSEAAFMRESTRISLPNREFHFCSVSVHFCSGPDTVSPENPRANAFKVTSFKCRELHCASFLIPKTAIEKFFQNGKPGLGRFASCVATSTRNAVFGIILDDKEASG